MRTSSAPQTRVDQVCAMLPALLLFAVPPSDLGVARLELSAGRADIVSAAGVTSLVGRSGARDIDGRAYMELGAASQLALRWRGEASLELRGAAAVEWRAPADQRGVLFTAWRVSELDFEVRRGPLRLDVGGGWRLELDVGAAGLRTLADGRIEVRHVAGSPLRIARDLGAGLVTPPWTLLPGGEVRLDAGASSSVQAPGSGAGAEFRGRALGPPAPGRERMAPAEPWSNFAWPWAAPARPSPSAPWPARATNHEQPDAAAPARIESGRIAPASSAHEAHGESSDSLGRDGRSGSIELPAGLSRARDASASAPSASERAMQTPEAPAGPPAQLTDGAAIDEPGHNSPSSETAPQPAPVAPTEPAEVGGAAPGSAAESATSADAPSQDAPERSAAAGDGELWRAARIAARMALLVQRAAPHGFALDAAPPASAAKPAPFDASRFAPLRRTGELVLTPFGPRWAERP